MQRDRRPNPRPALPATPRPRLHPGEVGDVLREDGAKPFGLAISLFVGAEPQQLWQVAPGVPPQPRLAQPCRRASSRRDAPARIGFATKWTGPAIGARGYPDNSRPVWLMGTLDMDGRWGWHQMDRELFGTVHERLKSFETMTWKAIEQGDSHFVSRADIIREAQRRLEELQQDDTDDLFSLRVQGRIRVWGIREGAALKLLWLDPEHEVCPSTKKHT